MSRSTTEDKENISNNLQFSLYQKDTEAHIYDSELECFPLSEDEDVNYKLPALKNGAITAEFLDQAEKCLLDIENYENNEEVKMKLINQLYQQIQLHKQDFQHQDPDDEQQYYAPENDEDEEDGVQIPDNQRNEESDIDEKYLECADVENMPNYGNLLTDVVGTSTDDEKYSDTPNDPTEMIIKPANGGKTFEQLLEEKLQADRELMPPPAPVTKPKRTFLKRGEGIARFNSAPKRKPPKSKSVMRPEPVKPINGHMITNNNTCDPPKRVLGMIRSNSIEKAPIKNKLPSKVKMEEPPLTVIPKDPQHACQPTASPVMSPVRNSPPRPGPKDSISNRLKHSSCQGGSGNHGNSGNQGNQCDISAMAPPHEVEDRLAADEDELEEFRMLEQAAADKSINSLIGMLKLANKSTDDKVDTIMEEKEESEEDEDFDDTETWGFGTPVKTFPIVNQDMEQENGGLVAESRVISRDNNMEPSKLLTNLFPGLKPPPPPAPPKPAEPKTDPEHEKLKNELKAKLAELEREVARFQREAGALARARTEKESELRKLREENDGYVKDLEGKERKFQEYKESEMKKLRAEKKQLEMSALSSQQRAAKLELVDSLTERVKDLEEELTRKEQKWNITFTRLKNRAETSEKDCEQLKTQITVLEHQKLELWEKEVERTSNRRHKNVQTTDAMNCNNIVTKTQGLPTTSVTVSEQLKPALKCKSEWEIPSKNVYVQFADNPTNNKKQSPTSKDRPETCISLYNNKQNNKQQIKQQNYFASPHLPPDSSFLPSVNGMTCDTECDITSSTTSSVRTTSSLATKTTGNGSGSGAVSGSGSGTVSSTESVEPDGSITTRYNNGTVKHISADGSVVTMTYFNGDVKKTYRDGRVIYKFKKDEIIQTQLPCGTEKIVFPNGQEETKFTDGRVSIKYPDNSTKLTYPNGEEKSTYCDGTIVTVDRAGQRLIVLPNGQKEIHTNAFKRREYPDGSVKTVYNDGRQETVHSNGRIRKKDARGKLISDVILDSRGVVVQDFLCSRT